jgi:hypothetical protein
MMHMQDSIALGTVTDVEAKFKWAYRRREPFTLTARGGRAFGTLATTGLDCFLFEVDIPTGDRSTELTSYRLTRDAHLEHVYQQDALFLREANKTAHQNRILVRVLSCDEPTTASARDPTARIILLITWAQLHNGVMFNRRDLLVTMPNWVSTHFPHFFEPRLTLCRRT